MPNNLPPLRARRIHIAGSASKSNEAPRLLQAHAIVRQVVRHALRDGARLVVQVSKEPRLVPDDPISPALLFDWTVIDEVRDCLADGTAQPTVEGEPLLYAVTSEKAESEIPEGRRSAWSELLATGAVWLNRIRPGSRSATAMRDLQARQGNALVIIGGGAGVEHLAEVYMTRRRPVVPLDAKIGSSRDDGRLRGEGLNALARSEPRRFFTLRSPGTEGARLAALTTGDGLADPDAVANGVVALLRDLTPPKAFFVRLFDRDNEEDFRAVESFFRDVVEPVCDEFGYQRHEVGTDDPTNAFANVEVFEELQVSPLAIVDLTGHRPNCFVELGYALRGEGKVFLTARKGTPRPFDITTLQWHFWENNQPDSARRALFRDYWLKQIRRPPLVQPSVPF